MKTWLRIQSSGWLIEPLGSTRKMDRTLTKSKSRLYRISTTFLSTAQAKEDWPLQFEAQSIQVAPPQNSLSGLASQLRLELILELALTSALEQGLQVLRHVVYLQQTPRVSEGFLDDCSGQCPIVLLSPSSWTITSSVLFGGAIAAVGVFAAPAADCVLCVVAERVAPGFGSGWSARTNSKAVILPSPLTLKPS